MADGMDYKNLLDDIIQGAKVGGAVIGEGVLAAAGAHPGIDNPDSTFSLIDMARGKTQKGKGLGANASLDEVLTDLHAQENAAKASKADKKSAKGKLAKAALGALAGGPPPAPMEQPQYMPTAVSFSPAHYAGGRPVRTKEEYEKGVA